MSKNKIIGLIATGCYTVAMAIIWKGIYDTELENARMQEQVADIKAKTRLVNIALGRES